MNVSLSIAAPPAAAPAAGARRHDVAALQTKPEPPAAPRAAEAPGIRAWVEAANRTAHSLSANVQFSYDAESGESLVRVVDRETGQVIRQIPSEDMIELKRALDRIAGLMIDQKA